MAKKNHNSVLKPRFHGRDSKYGRIKVKQSRYKAREQDILEDINENTSLDKNYNAKTIDDKV